MEIFSPEQIEKATDFMIKGGLPGMGCSNPNKTQEPISFSPEELDRRKRFCFHIGMDPGGRRATENTTNSVKSRINKFW
ncbi:hypothetical protein K9M41_03400 [Candidatus Gracilibacteria bacterium]|nr:hypothetical protein [Candidatus Gracilibacteria bacterium]